ncbi:MAG: lamin tail domain-containing protein [Candidatus Kapabacteria bacterium]|nr:lamin tail domain-containing protein [Candidatus Kapabacteria bacterium]
MSTVRCRTVSAPMTLRCSRVSLASSCHVKPPDMLEGGMRSPLFFVLFLLACRLPAQTQIIITEVHPTPASGEPEWIEVANLHDRPATMRAWYVCDNRTCMPLSDVTIAAGGLLVITSDAEALSESRYVPGTTTVIECRLPSLNNSVDRVELRSADSAVIDSVTYDVRRHIRGRSIERCGQWEGGKIIYGSTWAASMQRDSASCGVLNSCITLPNDLRVMPIIVGDSSLLIAIRNSGAQTSEPRRYNVRLGDFRSGGMLRPLEPGRSFEFVIERSMMSQRAEVHQTMLAVSIDGGDDRPENDTAESTITLPPLPGRLTISEIMAEPDDRQSEYIEIWNGTGQRVDLAGWSIGDASGRRCLILPPAAVLPNAYLAVGADSAVGSMAEVGNWTLMRPALNVNAVSDTVALRTPEGLEVDRTPYDKDSHADILTTRGRSLERRAPWSASVDVAAWTTCTHPSGGTPGRPNSIGRPPAIISGMKSWPDPCSADESSVAYPCIISWQQTIEQGIGRLRIFRLDGVQVAEVLNGELIGQSGAVVWDVRDAATGMAVAIGSYVAVLECTSLTTPEQHVDRCLINVGESAFVPGKR